MALCEYCVKLKIDADYAHPRLVTNMPLARGQDETLRLPVFGTCSVCDSRWRFNGFGSQLLSDLV